MKYKSISFLLGGVGLALGIYFVARNLAHRKRLSNLHVRTEDLKSPNLSSEDLASSHLTDLNVADIRQLKDLGLDAESVERLIENRPYRNKMELVSRMVLPQTAYAAIKNMVAVAEANEPIKVAKE